MVRSINSDSQGDSGERFANFLSNKKSLVALTGAGISVGSGIPTYRDEKGVWQRSEPITHQAFIAEPRARQRYWLRSFRGWPLVAAAEPTVAHKGLTALEQNQRLALTVTQNVDCLHQKSGSQRVVDLHGRIDEVICMDCSDISARDALQTRLGYLETLAPRVQSMAPDGDAEIEDDYVDDVVVPDCTRCGGMLKPNVVFFGDNVDRSIVQQIYDQIEGADGLLIIGSSLKVFSGFRFCRFAADHEVPICSINPGVSRGDELIDLKIEASADHVLADWQ